MDRSQPGPGFKLQGLIVRFWSLAVEKLIAVEKLNLGGLQARMREGEAYELARDDVGDAKQSYCILPFHKMKTRPPSYTRSVQGYLAHKKPRPPLGPP